MILDRYWKIFLKYGGVKSFYYILKWKLFNIKLNNIGTSISKIELSFFQPIGESKFKAFYKKDNEEVERIIKRERMILFYEYDDLNSSLDIKTKWELKRSQHGPILALNKSLESDEILENEFSNLNLSSILQDSNAMEVGIATINLLTTFQLLNTNDKKKYSKVFSKHLKESISYILINNEKGIIFSHNHYFFNLIAAIWILESIKGNKALQQTTKKLYKELNQLLKQIINIDGSLYEGSTHYHKYVTDSLLLFLSFIKNSQKNKQLLVTAKSMYKFSCYASFDNQLIGVGDNDSGRILALPKYFDYNSTDLRFTRHLAETLNFENFEDVDERKLATRNFLNSDSFGLFKIENPNWNISIRLNQNNDEFLAKFIGVHFHNDQLSILASYRGEKLFVDSGVYSYVQKNNIRYNNIRTSSHNTLTIDDLEQNIIFNDWNIPEREIGSKALVFNDKVFQGEYSGYKNAVYRRKIEVGEQLIIFDEILSEKPISFKSVKIFFHLHPSLKPTITDNGSVRLEIDENLFLMEFDKDCKAIIEKSIYSAEYGQYTENFKVVLIFENAFFNSCKTIISHMNSNYPTS